MHHISVSFRRDTNDIERRATLIEMRRMPGVHSAELLKADSSNEEIRRMAIVAVKSADVSEALAEHVARMTAVESATVAARRRFSD